MPDLVGELRQLDPLELALAGRVEQAELHLGGMRREQREVHAESIPGRPQWVRHAFRDARVAGAGHTHLLSVTARWGTGCPRARGEQPGTGRGGLHTWPWASTMSSLRAFRQGP